MADAQDCPIEEGYPFLMAVPKSQNGMKGKYLVQMVQMIDWLHCFGIQGMVVGGRLVSLLGLDEFQQAKQENVHAGS